MPTKPHSKILAVIHGISLDENGGFSITRRREQVCKIHHVCPACHASQVQLVDWFHPIVIRKCRICKHVHHQFIPEEESE
jgi:transcription elongation factor Elf1